MGHGFNDFGDLINYSRIIVVPESKHVGELKL
jgi:hypothetical protein